MKVQRLGFVSTSTNRFEETLRFFTEVIGLHLVDGEGGSALLQMPQADHDYMDVFGPDCEDCDFERQLYTTGPVPGFVVDDVVAAREEMAAAGADLVGNIIWSKRNEGYGWFHFRAPDGYI
jgi:catechol 2,3-dioxygenase-like lactoylglutathione lyase family enzyme